MRIRKGDWVEGICCYSCGKKDNQTGRTGMVETIVKGRATKRKCERKGIGGSSEEEEKVVQCAGEKKKWSGGDERHDNGETGERGCLKSRMRMGEGEEAQRKKERWK